MVKRGAILALSLSGSMVLGQSEIAAPVAQGSIKEAREAQSMGVAPGLTKRQPAATSVKEWIAQIESATVQVIRVRLERSDTTLEIVLETAEGKPLSVDASRFRTEGNSLVAEISNAVLVLPGGQAFVADNPTADIATVGVGQLDINTIQVRVTGNTALPRSEVTLKAGDLAYSLNPGEEEAETEIVVTAEQTTGRYQVPNSSVGTKIDTPLRDIPQSIQIVPQAVLRDQQINRLDDALRNVPGVAPDFNSGPYLTYRIRGFEALNNNLLRNGLVDAGAGEIVELSSVERVEVLKGPASVLFGLGNPGGSINIITKQPLQVPLYAISATIGNYDSYRAALDFSAPLNDSKSILYRLNASYRSSDSFIDFYNSKHFNISPVVRIAIGEKTKLTIEGDYIQTSDSGFTPFLPVNLNGSRPILPDKQGLPRHRNVGEPTDEIDTSLIRAGYRLEHTFNENWLLQNSFAFNFRDYFDKRTFPGSLDADNRTLSRSYREFDFQSISYGLSTSIVGKFSTGSLKHQLLVGVDFNSYENKVPSFIQFDAAPIDIFNPIYRQTVGAITFSGSNTTITNSLGIYLQDKVDITDQIKVLAGIRFDAFYQTSKDFFAGTESDKSDSSFSPRFGIVYQPIPAVSLYASYISSFTPADGVFLFGGSLATDFKPERGRQFEMGVKADFSDRASATLAFYDLTRTNVVVQDELFVSRQTGKQRSQGIELNFTGEVSPGWNFIAGYAYTDARVTEDENNLLRDNQLPNTPNHAFNLWTTYEIQKGTLKGLGFGLGLFYAGYRLGALENNYDLPSYLRTDAAIFYKRDKFRVGLNFKNLFDIEYFENGSSATRVNYGQPFTVQGSISWEF
jgi:iron complex outermembrane recepter protein